MARPRNPGPPNNQDKNQGMSAGASTVLAELHDYKKSQPKEGFSWQRIVHEVPVIRDAPYLFAGTSLVATVVAVLVLWYFNVLVPGVVVTSLNSQIGALNGQLGDYKQRLEGATPIEAQAEIEKLRKQIEQLSDDISAEKWEALNDDVITAIADALKDVPKRNVAVNFLDADSRLLVPSFVSAFKLAGWPMPNEPDVVVGWQKDGIWIGPIDDDNERIKNIIEEKIGMKLKFFPNRRQLNGPLEVNILIGYKPK